MYLQCHWQESKKSAKKRTTIIFYALCVLYGLSVAVAAMDVAVFMAAVSNNSVHHNNFTVNSKLFRYLRLMLYYTSAFLQLLPYCSAAVTSSPNVSWYA